MAKTYSSPSSYPLSPIATLKSQYVSKHLNDLPTPSAILDRAIIRRNCNAMLNVCAELGVGFRAHVKSHKTLELSKLQVGDSGPAQFVVSTLIEAEHLLPLLQECEAQGRECSLIYGVPIPQSSIPRLVSLASMLKNPNTVSIIIDNELAFSKYHTALSSLPTNNTTPSIGIYIKIDTGYHRAGIPPTSASFPNLVNTIISKSPEAFQGFYSHFGHSYSGSSEDDAANGLIEELTGLEDALTAVPSTFTKPLILTAGATPTATAAQNLLSTSSPQVQRFKTLLQRLNARHRVELHAGVYPLLDLQQVATHARPPTSTSTSTSTPPNNAAAEPPTFQPLSKDSIALKILLEITSTYPPPLRSKPEALVSAGSLCMGREPCKSYPGWGIVCSDLGNSGGNAVYDERGARTGWILSRIAQEHGILTWEGPGEEMRGAMLEVGDKVLLWPNHACVAGVGFGWYLVVDSDGEDKEVVVDVWARWRGW